MNLIGEIKKADLGIDGFVLKMLAIITMLIDHAGYIFFPQYEFLRIIGRISFPIFAFMIAEGSVHTHNLRKYAIRLAVFAFVSELPFDYAFTGTINWGHQNVLFTFLFAIAAIYTDKRFGRNFGFAATFLAGMLAEFCYADYGMFGVILVMIFYWNHDRFSHKMIISTAYLGLLPLQMGIQRFDVMAMIPIALYNGKRGINLKYFFYAFYPLHLVVLYVIHIIMIQ